MKIIQDTTISIPVTTHDDSSSFWLGFVIGVMSGLSANFLTFLVRKLWRKYIHPQKFSLEIDDDFVSYSGVFKKDEPQKIKKLLELQITNTKTKSEKYIPPLESSSTHN